MTQRFGNENAEKKERNTRDFGWGGGGETKGKGSQKRGFGKTSSPQNKRTNAVR